MWSRYNVNWPLKLEHVQETTVYLKIGTRVTGNPGYCERKGANLEIIHQVNLKIATFQETALTVYFTWSDWVHTRMVILLAYCKCTVDVNQRIFIYFQSQIYIYFLVNPFIVNIIFYSLIFVTFSIKNQIKM